MADSDFPLEVARALEGAAFEFGGYLENQLNQYLNEEDLVVSREMQASIEHRVRRDGGSPIEVLVGPTAEHTEYVHDGTGPAAGNDRYMPPEGVLRDWIVERGFASGLGSLDEREDLLRWHIYQHGTQPNPFLERFDNEYGDQYAETYSEIVQKRLNDPR